MIAVRLGGGIPQGWKYATIVVLDGMKDRKQCGNGRGTFLVAEPDQRPEAVW